MSELCTESVSDGMRWPHFHECGRPVKEDGLCGLHLGARKRRVAADQRDKEKRSRQTRLLEDVAAELARLNVKGSAEYSSIQRQYSGRVVITLEELRRVMEVS